MRYANRAKNIKNRARVNEDPKDALLRQFQVEIEQLRQQLEEDAAELSGSDGDSEESQEKEIMSGEKKSLRSRKKEMLVEDLKDDDGLEKADKQEKEFANVDDVDIIELQRTQLVLNE